MVIHFANKVYIVITVAALQTAKDSFRLRIAPPLMQQSPSHARLLTKRVFHHVNYGQRDVVFQRDIEALHYYIASFLKEFCAS